MSCRHNPTLDDAFGVSPATWGREPDQPAAPVLPPARRVPRHPAESVPIRLPEGYALANGRIVRVPNTPDAQAFAALLAADQATQEPVLATVPAAAAALERPEEELLYTGGRWYHRCAHCGDHERILVVRPGCNPAKDSRPLFAAPRGEPIRHRAGCPHTGQF